MAGQSIVVSILADTKPLSKGLDDGAGFVDKFGKGFRNLAVGVAAGVAITGVAVGKFVADSISAAGESQKVAAQTDAVVKSTGGAAGRTAEQIGDLALELSNLTGIDDEVVQGAENILATFTQIKGDQFDETTKAALNMSVALGTDASSAAQTLGKALNDPAAGLTKLTKSGVTFTDQQKEQIKAMQEAGDIAGAQTIILQELEKEFGGSAEAYGATFEGLKDRVSNAFGNIQETFGTAFLPVLSSGLEEIAGLLQRVGESDEFAEITDNVAGFVEGLISGAPGVAEFVGNAADFVSAFSPLVALFQLLDPYMPRILDGAEKLGKVVGGELTDGWAELYPVLKDTVTEIKDNLAGALEDNGPKLDELGESALDLSTNLAEDLIPALIDMLIALAPLLPQIVELGTDSLPVLLDVLTLLLAPTGEQSTAFGDLAGVVVFLAGAVSTLIGFLPGPLPLFGELIGVLDGTQTASELTEKALRGDLGPAIQFIAEATGTAAEGTRVGISNISSNIRQMSTNVQTNVSTAFSNVRSNISAAWTDASSRTSQGVQNIVGYVGGIPNRIVGAIGNLGGLLVSAGGDVVEGLLRGINTGFGRIASIARRLADTLVSNVESALGINSPSRKAREIMGYFIDGIIGGGEDGLPRVSNFADSLSSLLLDGVPAMPDAGALYDAEYGFRTGDTIIVQASMLTPTPAAGRAIAESIEEYKRLGGK